MTNDTAAAARSRIQGLSIYSVLGFCQGKTSLSTTILKFLRACSLFSPVVLVIFEFLGTYLMFETSIKGSRRLFHRFLSSLLRLPLSFFERTPVGRIINRCSFDFDLIDDDMMFTLRSTLNALLAFITCCLVIGHYLPETIPIMILIFIPFVFLEVNLDTMIVILFCSALSFWSQRRDSCSNRSLSVFSPRNGCLRYAIVRLFRCLRR